MVADIEELEEMDASELHAEGSMQKDVLTPMKGDSFKSPVADGTVKVSGGDRRLRTSTLIRDRLERGEEKEVFRGKIRRTLISNPMISGPLQKISFIATHRRYQNDIHILGCIVGENFEDYWNVDGKRNCQMHAQASQDSSY